MTTPRRTDTWRRVARATEAVRAAIHDELSRAHPVNSDGALMDAEVEAHLNRTFSDAAADFGGEPGRVRVRLERSNVLASQEVRFDCIDSRTGSVIQTEAELWRLLGL